MSRLEKGGNGGKSASRVGKNLKMLIESARLFGTHVYLYLERTFLGKCEIIISLRIVVK